MIEHLKENPFVSLQRDFSTFYKINRHVQTSSAFGYIAPVEIKLPADADGRIPTVQYVPVIELLNTIVSDPDFTPTHPSVGDMIHDIKDGSAWKESKYHQDNPEALTGVLYSDALEICNPLGARKGVFKILCFYITLVDIPKHLRSKTENWFLVMMVHDKDMKKHRETIYKILAEDLSKLEKGVYIGTRFLQMGIICWVGDNLERHNVGGFSGSFSSRDICSDCHQQYDELSNISGVPSAKKWTREEHDQDVLDFLARGRTNTKFGVSGPCVFNILESFHAVGQMPFDCLHDFMEKVGAFDAQAVIVSLVAQHKFTLSEYNSMLTNLQLSDYESSDRPLPVKAQSEKLTGKAMAVAQHLRMMPFLLQNLLDENFSSILLDLLFLLHEMQEYILADSYNPADILSFEELSVKYFDKRKACSTEFPTFCKLTPKFHFIEHYSRQMEHFGPFTGVWTARCESKHRDYVNFSESAKNHINLLKTLAVKNQRKLASR